MSKQSCRVCGRPVPQRDRGRPKEAHQVCIALESRLGQVDDLLSQVKFQDKRRVSRMRGDLFRIVNGSLRPDAVKITPGDAEDAPIKTRREITLSVQKKENNV